MDFDRRADFYLGRLNWIVLTRQDTGAEPISRKHPRGRRVLPVRMSALRRKTKSDQSLVNCQM